jgi:hypothetical protein
MTSRSRAAIFVGPSLVGARKLEAPGIDWRAPAQSGDIITAVADGMKIIGLIDGYFETRPAVWHKEILFALHQGVRVLGAASMGALRAAELHSLGMEGIGSIFEDYASGRQDRDDAVAVSHGPPEIGYVNLSESLVNMQATLTKARSENVIQESQYGTLSALADDLFFKDRTWDALLARAEAQGMAEGVTATFRPWLTHNRVDLKAQDAMALIARVQNALSLKGEGGVSVYQSPRIEPPHPGPLPPGEREQEVDTRPKLVASIYLRDLLKEQGWEINVQADGSYTFRHDKLVGE